MLYQNMKCGTLAAKELTDFFRESAKLEEENAKTHAKLAKQVVSIFQDYDLLFYKMRLCKISEVIFRFHIVPQFFF